MQTTATDRLAHQLICEALRGATPSIPAPAPQELVMSLGRLARLHGVEALLHASTSAAAANAQWPDTLTSRWAAVTRAQAAVELLQQRTLAEFLHALASANIPALLLKGTPLAYTLYDAPYLRPRGDTDILIQKDKRDIAHGVLVDCGYSASPLQAHHHASYQRTYTKHDPFGGTLVIDLHWALSNRQLFAHLFSFDDLWHAAVPVPALGDHAHALSDTHTLLHACLHRAVHFRAPMYVDGSEYIEPNRLIWLYDIRLLTLQQTDIKWQRFVELACRTNLRSVCMDALNAAKTTVDAVIPNPLLAQMQVAPGQEPAAQYLAPAGVMSTQLGELRAMPGLSAKLLLLLDVAFPPAAHMLNKYKTNLRWLLPFLYLRRGVDAVIRAVRVR